MSDGLDVLSGEAMLTLAHVRRTTRQSPTQFEGMSVDGRPVYVHCRHGTLSVRVGLPGEEIDDAIGTAPAVELEFADQHRSEIDWIEVEALTGIRRAVSAGSVAVRDAGAGDVVEIATLMREVRSAALPYLPVLHDAGQDRAFITALLFTHIVRVAFEGASILGFSARREGWVDHLYVGLGTQKQGNRVAPARGSHAWQIAGVAMDLPAQ